MFGRWKETLTALEVYSNSMTSCAISTVTYIYLDCLLLSLPSAS